MSVMTHYKIESYSGVTYFLFAYDMFICIYYFFSFFVHFYFMCEFSEVSLHFGLLPVFSQTVTEFEE